MATAKNIYKPLVSVPVDGFLRETIKPGSIEKSSEITAYVDISEVLNPTGTETVGFSVRVNAPGFVAYGGRKYGDKAAFGTTGDAETVLRRIASACETAAAEYRRVLKSRTVGSDVSVAFVDACRARGITDPLLVRRHWDSPKTDRAAWCALDNEGNTDNILPDLATPATPPTRQTGDKCASGVNPQ